MAALAPTMAAIKGFGAKMFATAFSSTGAALSTGGTILGTAGAIAGAKQADAMAKYQARLAEKRADEEMAAAAKKAQNEKRAAHLAISRARAVGAASGGGVDTELIGDLEEEGTLRSLNAIWEGQTAHDNSMQEAAEARYRGKTAKRRGFLTAGATLLGGGASLMDKYG